MDVILSQVRGYGLVIALLIAVAAGLWLERTRLRPWHLWLPVFGFIASALGLFIGAAAQRSGGFSGWAALLPVLIYFGSFFFAAVCATALITLAVLLPRYGFDRRPADVRGREYQQWRYERGRARSQRWLAFYTGLIVIGSLAFKVRELRYQRMLREQQAKRPAPTDTLYRTSTGWTR